MVDNGLLKELPDVNEALTNELLPGEGLELARPFAGPSVGCTSDCRQPTVRLAAQQVHVDEERARCHDGAAPRRRRRPPAGSATPRSAREREHRGAGGHPAGGHGDRAARQRQRQQQPAARLERRHRPATGTGRASARRWTGVGHRGAV